MAVYTILQSLCTVLNNASLFTFCQDAVELLEKRVKSRFSHRQITLLCDYSFEDYLHVFFELLALPNDFGDHFYSKKWTDHLEVHTYVCGMFNCTKLASSHRTLVRTCKMMTLTSNRNWLKTKLCEKFCDKSMITPQQLKLLSLCW